MLDCRNASIRRARTHCAAGISVLALTLGLGASQASAEAPNAAHADNLPELPSLSGRGPIHSPGNPDRSDPNEWCVIPESIGTAAPSPRCPRPWRPTPAQPITAAGPAGRAPAPEPDPMPYPPPAEEQF
ncbi:MAG: hypothetical protein M3071_04180 [Actinomycetota bacterium]|nr:hypothetical protein [Actinomycetota bacterium]